MGFGEDYGKAYKMGKKDYQYRMLHGLKPTLAVLEDILPPKGSYTEMPLGLVQIPLDQIVGTRYEGRSSAFSGNFLPILNEGSEFARKWEHLNRIHLQEGFRDPIKAYEYMNQFYVEEGNKRVSVMKYYDVISIPGNVTRIIPKRSEEPENKIYYEFLDFYELTKMNDIYFTKEGSFKKLQKEVGKEPFEKWTDEEKRDFKSIYYRFMTEYRAKGGDKLSITVGDAFLALISIYGYESICDQSTRELKNLIAKSWEEFTILGQKEGISLKMAPNTEKEPLLNSLFSGNNKKLKVCFIYEKQASSSAWTYAHELGRLHLEQTFPEEVETMYYDNVTTDNIEAYLEQAIRAGCNPIFTTTPAFVQASVKAAIAHPQIRICNCSLNTSHRYIRTYYARMHEAKFLMGAIAGAMAKNDKLMYVEDYPIYGSIANINAFALGAKMINPRVKVYLEWSSRKDFDARSEILKIQPDYISGKDMVIPEDDFKQFGIFSIEDGQPRSLAMPLCHWGKFYEQLIRTIMKGTWKYDDDPTDKKAINYWWGMSSGVVDVITSQNLPYGTVRLVDFLKKTISRGQFNPFSGILYSQDGIVQPDPKKSLSPEEIITMDWLAENVIGSIPKDEELKEYYKPIISQQGLEK